MTAGTYVAFHPSCVTVRVKYQWEVWSGACLPLLLPFRRRHPMLEFSGSLKAPQLQVGPFGDLQGGEEFGSLPSSTVLWLCQTFATKRQWMASEVATTTWGFWEPSALLSGQASYGRMRTQIYHCSWVAFLLLIEMLSVYQYSHFGGIADPTKKPPILSGKTSSPPSSPGTIIMRFTTQL